MDRSDLQTVLYDERDHVATVTLNRPDQLNAFDQRTLDDFAALWRHVRATDAIHVVVLRAAGDRAFCTGVDVKAGIDRPPQPLERQRSRRGPLPQAQQRSGSR